MEDEDEDSAPSSPVTTAGHAIQDIVNSVETSHSHHDIDHNDEVSTTPLNEEMSSSPMRLTSTANNSPATSYQVPLEFPSSLTPCLVQKGKGRKSKGRRVTISEKIVETLYNVSSDTSGILIPQLYTMIL